MAGVAPITAVRQFFLNEGTLAANGTLETLVANSGTRSPTWTDKAQASNFLNTNPITLDSRGEATVWLDPAIVYDFILRDSLGSTIKTYEDVSGASASISVVTGGDWVDPALVATFITGNTFSLIGDQTDEFSVNRRIRATIGSGFRYGYITNSVFSSVTTVTVAWDSGTIDASLSKVEYGLISTTNTSLPGAPSNLVSANGYKYFTEGAQAGLLLQWGSISTSSVSTTTVTLPKAFVTACFYCDANAGTSPGSNFGSAFTSGLTTIGVNTFNPTTGARVSLAGVQWWALGK